MKCREFMFAAESLTLSQLSLMRNEDAAISEHARECAACGRWLESQTLLDNAMQALRASTARREASPQVEHAVLEVFRATGFASQEAVEPESAAPAAWRLSHLFEYGAYAAVAAALILAVFLGSRLLHDRQMSQHKIQARTGAAPQTIKATTTKTAGTVTSAEELSSARAVKVLRVHERDGYSSTVTGRSDSSAIDSDEYDALMLCDPLICSGDEQVIRMELPANTSTGGSGQPVTADVVVGDDGLVRAMRIVR